MTKNTLEKTPVQKEEEFMVVKRNGKIVPFQKNRILFALQSAFKEQSPINEDAKKSIESLADIIADKLLLQAAKGSSLTVEGIQDFVEVSLMKKGFHEVAKSYILYRNERKKKRELDPAHIKIFRQDKQTQVRFNPIKIASSIERSLRKAENISEKTPKNLVEIVNSLTEKVIEGAMQRWGKGDSLYIEDIQNSIEEILMEQKFFQAAKEYILSRAKKEQGSFSKTLQVKIEGDEKTFILVTKEGEEKKISERFLKTKFSFACRGLEDQVDLEDLLHTSIMNFYEGMKEHELDLSNIFAARSKIEKDPAYAKVASRLLLDVIYRETIGISASDPSLRKSHQTYFRKMIKDGVRLGRLHQDLLDFDLDYLAENMDLENDDRFSYLGIQTLYDRYFIHENERRLETPQIFWMRVAMGLAKEEEQKNERAVEFYQTLSTFHFVSSTPTLFNSGTLHPQLSSCYLSTVEDDLQSIFKLISDDALLSKWAGGLGNDWTPIRSTGSKIHGTNGKSQGVIPFLKVANDTAVAVNQCFHPDTLIYTENGVKPIDHIQKGDLVLGISGRYQEVLDTYRYDQKDAMMRISLHDGESIHVTSEHPFYALRGEKASWILAKDLQPTDLLAKIVPQEILENRDISCTDAKAYGAFLKDGWISANGQFWCFKKTNQFLKNYVEEKGFSLEEDDLYTVNLSQEMEGTGGSTSFSSPFPFNYEDVYNENKEKRIAKTMSHLPIPKTKALLDGLMENSRFAVDSSLLQDVKYQALRAKIPTILSEGFLEVDQNFSGKIEQGALFTPIKTLEPTDSAPFVYDLLVDRDESYMTTAALAHNGGKRKGAMCAYLETWHLDIEDFLELRKNTGDERRRTHDMNTANWIPDLFMKRVREKGMWTLFSPSDTPDLHDLYGQAFEKRYEEYEKMAEEGKIALYKKVEAELLWRKMLSMLFETGHPWITFKDPSNIRSTQDHKGVVHSSNLCTEILLNTNSEEVAVCNLGSINLKEHVTEKGLDEKKLKRTIQTAVRMLDNVIDINFYPIPEAKNANMRHRPVGLGLMGFQDALYLQNISYSSKEAAEFADQSMEIIAYYAYLASSNLAKERGPYSSYKGSKWDRGLLPLDTLDLLEKERNMAIDVDRSSRLDWETLRKTIQKQGMRNSNVLAIAPTATIANIAGVIPSIEPMYKHLFVKSNLSGEFTSANPYLVEKLKEQNLWDEEMIDDLKYFDGSIQEIERIPDGIKQVFPTAFETDFFWVIECAARRQKWIDMGQSLNLYLSQPSGKKLNEMYMLGWTKGLKTQYYLRALAATQIEKSSMDVNRRGIQPRWMKNKSASGNIQVERTLSCSLEEGCESCQ